jgi:hypothetical protein
MPSLESLQPSKTKKLKAVFRLDNGRTKTIHFGAKGYSDYTQHHSEERKENYIRRHEVREDFNNPMTAGALSRWLLWNKPTLLESIYDYKKRFRL